MTARLKTKEVMTLLRESGFKVTPQRLAIYEVLSHTKAHPNAEMLYQELKPYYPTMSLATIYKALGIFCEVGLAQALNVGEESFRFDANAKAHPHIRCAICGRVDDIENLPEKAMEQQAGIATGYEVTGHQYYFFGICPNCKKRQKH